MARKKAESPILPDAPAPPVVSYKHPAKRKNIPPAGLFPNEASLLRLVSAILAEVSDEWETGKIYLNVENQTQPSV